MLEALRRDVEQGSFVGFVRSRSAATRAAMLAQPLAPDQEAAFRHMAEASVAVKMPPRIPPMTTTTSSRLGMASQKARITMAKEGRSATG